MQLSFYSAPTELRRNTYYIREVDDLNATRQLRFVLVVTSVVPALDEAVIGRTTSCARADIGCSGPARV